MTGCATIPFLQGGEDVKFPFPPKELSPNSRLHWAKRAKAVKSYRQECMYELAAKYGVQQTTIGNIVRNKTWRHVR